MSPLFNAASLSLAASSAESMASTSSFPAASRTQREGMPLL
jgi:hypothetical protein